MVYVKLSTSSADHISGSFYFCILTEVTMENIFFCTNIYLPTLMIILIGKVKTNCVVFFSNTILCQHFGAVCLIWCNEFLVISCLFLIKDMA